MKVSFDKLRKGLPLREKLTDVSFEFVQIASTLPAYCICFHVLIQQFIRIQFRAVSRHKKHSDPILIFLQPALNCATFVNRMAVDNKENAFSSILDETIHEINEYYGCKLSSKQSELQSPPVRNARNHIAAEPFTSTGNGWRLSFWGPRRASLMVRSHPGLVAPYNFPAFCPCGPLDCWILMRKPAPYFFIAPLICFALRFLRCKSPCMQITPDGPYGKMETILPFNQHLNRLTCPQDKRKLHLLRASIGNNPDNCCSLMSFEPRCRRAAASSRLQRINSVVLFQVDPFCYRATGHAKQTGCLFMRFTLLNSSNGLQSNDLLRRSRERTSINIVHAYKIYSTVSFVSYFMH
jgi:hypothetical protein